MTFDFVFLGASCTHQATNHKSGEVTGYVEYIIRHYAALFDLNCRRLTYPSKRFGNIAYALVSNLLQSSAHKKPDVIVLELMIEDHGGGKLRGYEYYEEFVSLLISNGVFPVFLNLPHATVDEPAAWGKKYDYVM